MNFISKLGFTLYYMKKPNINSNPALDELIEDIDERDYDKTEKRMMLAAKIDDALKLKGWKNKDLAKALRKSTMEISMLMSGTYNFTVDILSDIEKFFGIQLFYFED